MSELAPGTSVRVRLDDRPGHTRAPRYVRGRVGVVEEVHGAHPVPDVVVGEGRHLIEPVYAVRFTAAELFGEGEHEVVVNLWQRYLVEEDR